MSQITVDARLSLTIDLPEDLHTRFKIACARNKTTMAFEVNAFIVRRTAELEGQFLAQVFDAWEKQQGKR